MTALNYMAPTVTCWNNSSAPTTNQRADAWGGSVDKRIKFVVEVVRETAAAIGGDKLGIRLSPCGTNSGMVA